MAAADSAFSQSCLFAATSNGAPYSSLLPSARSSAVFASSILAASAAGAQHSLSQKRSGKAGPKICRAQVQCRQGSVFVGYGASAQHNVSGH